MEDEGGDSSSERETKTHLEQEKYDISELMAQNQFCVTCGIELTGDQKKFPSCEHCGAFLVEKMKDPQWQVNDLEQENNTAELEGFAIHFHHGESLSAEDAVVLRGRENTRKETLLGLSMSIQSWSEDMTKSFPK